MDIFFGFGVLYCAAYPRCRTEIGFSWNRAQIVVSILHSLT